MASEPFDAVLADMLGESTLFLHEITDYYTRLAAAHAAEVAERDARIAELDSECRQHLLRALENGQAALAAEARAEADARDAGRYRMIRNPPPKGDAMCAWSTTEDGVLSARGKHDGPLTGEPLDAAIDKAIATTEQADE